MPEPDETDEVELPSTIARSPAKARRTFAATLASARRSYGGRPGGEARARRTAFAALKHSFEKVGDRWEPKAHRGPSDDRAAGGGPEPAGGTAGGVDAHATLGHLRDLARRLDISGRSRMGRDELVAALQRANRRATARARGDGRSR